MIYKCTVAYDGSKFSGWQKQPGIKTVQDTIESALSIIQKQNVSIHGSGRTDAGVHAFGQVFHFESHLNMDADAYQRALNALLPKSVFVHKVEIVNDLFHARFHARSKTYQYRLNTDSLDIFRIDYEYQLNQALDTEAMRQCAAIFNGTHDFTSFNATELNIVSNQIRTISHFNIEDNEGHLVFEIKGDGFLRYMVRMLIAACVEVGLGRLNCDDIRLILDSKNKNAFNKNIDSCGLYLLEVDYEEV